MVPVLDLAGEDGDGDAAGQEDGLGRREVDDDADGEGGGWGELGRRVLTVLLLGEEGVTPGDLELS